MSEGGSVDDRTVAEVAASMRALLAATDATPVAVPTATGLNADVDELVAPSRPPSTIERNGVS